MMLLYLALLLLLVLVHLLVLARTNRLARKYDRLARAAQSVLNQPVYRQGNNNRSDPLGVARQHYRLGQLVEQRDRVEAHYEVWQARSDRLARWLARYRSLKGRFVPYLAGVVDMVLALLGLTTLGYLDPATLRQAIETLLSRVGG
jgi:hypothetical protein